MICPTCYGLAGSSCPKCLGDGVVCNGCHLPVDECDCPDEEIDPEDAWLEANDHPEDDPEDS